MMWFGTGLGFMGWGLGSTVPRLSGSEHSTYDRAVNEAKRVLAVLPQFREENAEMEQWLPVKFPKEPDKAIVYPDPFDCERFGMDFEHSTVEDHRRCGDCVNDCYGWLTAT